MADSAQIIRALQALTSKSQNVLDKAQSLGLGSGPNPYPPIIAGIDEIVVTAGNLASDVHGTPTIEGPAATSISDAFKEFVRVHQSLVHLLTSKAQLFKTGGPVADELRVADDAFDSLASNLNKHVNSDFKVTQASLGKTIRASIRAHEKAAGLA